jgi:hypothetical protein
MPPSSQSRKALRPQGPGVSAPGPAFYAPFLTQWEFNPMAFARTCCGFATAHFSGANPLTFATGLMLGSIFGAQVSVLAIAVPRPA